MRKASTILSWIFGVVTAAFLLIKGAMGILTTHEGGECMTFLGTRICDQGELVHYTPTWLWVIIIVFVVLDFVVLILREISLKKGNKILVGVLTIIFCSAPGGVLTLCIPEYQLY